jgi:hypothetical protein
MNLKRYLARQSSTHTFAQTHIELKIINIPTVKGKERVKIHDKKNED